MTDNKKGFKKVLYLKQDYPDNYVDHTFLQDLERNVNVKYASLPSLLSQTLPITQQIAATFIFVSIFVKLYAQELSTTRLLALDAVICIASYTASILFSSNPAIKAIEIPPVPLFVLYLLSPTLKTLTKATTSDSIWALSGILLTVSLLLGDYRPRSAAVAFQSSARSTNSAVVDNSSAGGRRPSYSATVNAPTVSLTAALAGSTVLASRLESNEAVFSLLLFASIWFGPFPTWRSSWSRRTNVVATVTMSLVAVVVVPREARTWVALLVVGSAFGAPLLRGALMIRLKDRIRGPWDQVVPVIVKTPGS